MFLGIYNEFSFRHTDLEVPPNLLVKKKKKSWISGISAVQKEHSTESPPRLQSQSVSHAGKG